MLKLEDFKIHELETLELINGGGQTHVNTNTYRMFLGYPVPTGSRGDVVDDMPQQ